MSRIHALRSVAVERSNFASRAGLSFEDDRDLFEALGYPRDLTTSDYRDRYTRGGIAKRIVEAAPKATWLGGAEIFEVGDPGKSTKFEEEVKLLFDRLDLFSRLLRADILAGLGQYSILLIGAKGEPTSKLPNLGNQEKILYFTAIPEENSSILQEVENINDERFGLPEIYQLKLGQGNTKEVHWSRCIHIAEGLLENDVYGEPRLRPVWNYLDDLAKIVGGGAEAAWKRMDPGMQINLDPEYEISSADETALSDEIDEYLHGMRRTIRTRGADINLLAASVTNFGPNADAVIKLISATTGIPYRILTGSERGELASSQDRGNWADRITERRREFATPILRSLIDRLIEHKALPEPKQYEVRWPEIDELNEREKSAVANALSQANRSQRETEGKLIITSNEIREHILKLGPLDDEDEPDGLFSRRRKGEVSKGEVSDFTGEPMVDKNTAPNEQPPSDDTGYKPILRSASIESVLKNSWDRAKSALDMSALEQALSDNDADEAERIIKNALLAARGL